MKCNEVKTILSEYIDGILDKQKAGHIKGHLVKCKACKEEFFSLRSLLKEIGALKPVQSPDNFLATLYERMEISSLLDEILDEEKQPLPGKTENPVAETESEHEDISDRIEELLKIGEESFEAPKKNVESDSVLKPEPEKYGNLLLEPDPDEGSNVEAGPGIGSAGSSDSSDRNKAPNMDKVPPGKTDAKEKPGGSSDEWDLNEFQTMEFSAASLYNVLDKVLGPDEDPLPEKPEKKSDSPVPAPDMKSEGESHENEHERKKEEAPVEEEEEEDDDEAMRHTYVFDMGIPAGEFDESSDASKKASSEISSQEVDADKKRESASGNRILRVILIIAAAAVAGAAIYGIYTLRDNEIFQNFLRKVPFVGGLLDSEAQEAGKMAVVKSTITSRFVENPRAGRLFVITGRVKNEYSMSHGFIKISGKLYAKGEVVARETVYCGNALSDAELSELTAEAIKERLSNRPDESHSKRTIEAGEAVPYMIVLFDTPDNPDNFTVEIAGALPSQE
ncbi:DUF3426 domain-containing protein [Desulfobacterales bacterium HSG2]|nr:DUF3426 domain-containing protein [Desulfobacterales bacterium HSG2]